MSSEYSRNALDSYRAIGVWGGVEAAGPRQLVQLMLDGTIDFIVKARASMEDGDVPSKAQQIGRAMAIVDALQSSLDHERGGEIAVGLDSLYDYIVRRLALANARNEVAILDESARLLGEIREAWVSLPADAGATEEAHAAGAV